MNVPGIGIALTQYPQNTATRVMVLGQYPQIQDLRLTQFLETWNGSGVNK